MHDLVEQLNRARSQAVALEGEGSRQAASNAWVRVSELMARFAQLATTAEAATRIKRAAEYRKRAEDILTGRILLRSPSGAAGNDEVHGLRWLAEAPEGLSFEDVAGLADVKQQLRQMVLLPLHKPELAKVYGVSVGGGLLLYGPPGTGKTLIAKALAGEVEACYFYVSTAALLSKWVSEAEQNVVQLFADARSMSPAVVFIDELEALAASRDQPDSSGVMRRVLTQLLQELDGFKGRPEKVLVLGATNRPWEIDAAALRSGRFDVHVYVPLPDEQARRHILELHMRGRPLSPSCDLTEIARRLEGWSGADLGGLCDQVARDKLQQVATEFHDGEPVPITGPDFDSAIPRRRASVGPSQVATFDRWRIGASCRST